jgi:hypothetical protein
MPTLSPDEKIEIKLLIEQLDDPYLDPTKRRWMVARVARLERYLAPPAQPSTRPPASRPA